MFSKQQVLFYVFFVEIFLIKDVLPRKNSACQTAFENLQPLENGRLQHTKSYNKMKYVCRKGFVLVPHVGEVKCKQGMFEVVPPKCKVRRETCPPPIVPAHGSIIPEKPELTKGSKITFICDKDYLRIGSRKRTCGKHGYWTGIQPVCETHILCPKPEGIDYGFVNVSGNITGSTAEYHCKGPEYELVGNSIRTCKNSGRWSSKPPLCQEKRCKEIKKLTQRIRNGHWHSSDPNYKLYSTIEFSCDEGYELTDGPRTLVCVEHGWTPLVLPKCREPVCPQIELEHGRTCCGRTFKINSTITFTCNSGFTLLGSKSLHCKDDKSWSGTPPVCDDGAFDCVNPGIPVNGRKDGFTYNQNDMVKFVCKKNFILVGAQNTTCINNTWTNEHPQCIDKYDDRFFPKLNETALRLKENVIDVLKQSTCSSENATCDTRGRSIVVNDVRGLDLVFVLDKSGSISRDEFLDGLSFVKQMIDTFGVSSIDDPTGTQIALVTYSHQATLEFNLGDDRASTPKGAKELVDDTVYSGGGTNTRAALDMVDQLVFPMARPDSTKVLFIIADGNSNIGFSPEKKADELREIYGFHIHVLAIGDKINKAKLGLLADEPLKEHFFQLKDYANLAKLMDAVKTEDKNLDYDVCGQSPFDPRGRIIGGIKTEKGEWPWMISLLKNNKHICGGSILNRRWILTAAHCFEEGQIQKSKFGEPNTVKGTINYQIIAGDYLRLLPDPVEQIRSPYKIYVHQNWNKTRFSNDIALIKLKDNEELLFSRFARPVCLLNDVGGPEREKLIKPGHSTIAVGWGRTSIAQKGDRRNKDLSDVLLRTSMPIAESKKCAERAKVNGDYYNDKTMLCVGDGLGGNDTCYADSGGPLVAQYFDQQEQKSSWVQVGIVSWGTGCGLPGEYGLYTHLKSYSQWIDDVMQFDAMNAEFEGEKR